MLGSRRYEGRATGLEDIGYNTPYLIVIIDELLFSAMENGPEQYQLSFARFTVKPFHIHPSLSTARLHELPASLLHSTAGTSSETYGIIGTASWCPYPLNARIIRTVYSFVVSFLSSGLFLPRPSTPFPQSPAFFPHFIIPHACTHEIFGGGFDIVRNGLTLCSSVTS